MNFKLNGILAQNTYEGEEREGYTLSYIPNMNSLLVYGGARDHYVHLFNLNKKKWTKQSTQGKPPSSSKYHTMHYQQNSNLLIVYGGEVQAKNSSKDFHVLVLESWKWKKIFLLYEPPQRQNHLMLPYKGDLIVFGGLSLPYQKLLSDVFILKNINNLEISNKQEVHGCQCSNIQTYGETPQGRYGASGFIHEKMMYVVGGRSHNEEKDVTIYSLCLRKYTWKLQKIKKQSYMPQIHMASVFNVAGVILILGGIVNQSMKRNKQSYILSINGLSVQSSLLLKGTDKCINGNCCLVTRQPILLVNLYWKLQSSSNQPIIKFMYEHAQSQGPNPVSKTSVDKYFKTEEIQPEEITIQQYLIAIKNEQILSQQLMTKNNTLQLLYKEIQKYISKLHRTYAQTQQPQSKVEKHKQEHITHCLELKENYSKISQDYEQTVGAINQLRLQLTNIDGQFDKCMDTEFDEDA